MFFEQSFATKMKLVTSVVVDPNVAGVTSRGEFFTPELAVRVTGNKNALGKAEQANKASLKSFASQFPQR